MNPEEKNYLTKVGKILSHQKNPDRFNLVSIHKPQDKEEREHGTIYFIMEILSPDPTIGRVGKIIEATIINEYYQDLDDGLTSLEMALKKVNEKLTELADEGEIGWIGKINAVIAVLEKNILHITQSGTAESYLIRANKITHITEGLSSPSEKPNPLKTFVNIASGDLLINDKVLISTSELFYHFSLDDLRRICNRFSPAIAASYIVKMLRREEVESINTLILELSETQLEAERSFSEMGKKILGEEKKLLAQYKEKLVPIWKKVLSKSRYGVKYGFDKSLEKSKEVYGSKIAPGINRFAQEANKRVNEKLNEKLSSTQQINDDNLLGFINKKDLAGLTKIDSGRKVKISKENLDQKNLFDSPKRNMVLVILKPIKVTFQKINVVIKKSKLNSQIFAILAIVLLVFLVISGLVSYQKKAVIAKRDRIEQSYLTLKTKVEGAIKANELGDAPKAQMLLEEAQNEIKDLESSTYLKDEIFGLKQQIEQGVEKIFNIQRVDNVEALTKFMQGEKEAKLNGVFRLENKVYVTDKENHKALAYSLTDKKVDDSISLSFDGVNESKVLLNDKSSIALFNSDPENIYIYASKTLKTEKMSQITEESWPKAKAINSYLNNIYLLVPEDNQIYRYTSLISSYSTKGIYLKNSADLTNAIDLAIDGSIYVLNKDGSILKFTAGAKNDFTVSGIPSNPNDKDKNQSNKIISPLRIITTEEMPNIYIADAGGKRVLVLTKEGRYVTQYVSAKWSDMKDVWVSYENKKLYVLSGSEIFEINIK